MRPRSSFFAFAIAGAALVSGLALWSRHERAPAQTFRVFARGEAACVIEAATVEERRAAAFLAQSLRAASDRGRTEIRVAAAAPARARVIRFATGTPDSLWDERYSFTVGPREIVIRATRASELPSAASWFLEAAVGARWFAPGKLGVEVDERAVLELTPTTRSFAPGYFSRHLGLRGRTAEQAWHEQNRLVSRFETGHTAAALVRRDDILREPSLAPLVNGRRYVPGQRDDSAWQPDLNSPATIELVTARLREHLRKSAARPAAAFGQNDSWKWDQSDATLAAVAPHLFFRGYPDYANTLFRFLNSVATNLAREFPERLLTTYAYQWTENVPRFPVHPNVLPYLTADRSQWFDPAFAANDRDLLQRWGEAGPRFFGLYDYYYGAPFLVPRPTLFAVQESIPFAHRAGARAFYAETSPNWGLDGPKAWLAAQLLWDPAQDSAALLDEYYQRYWKEAAAPMREFFAICDRQYLTQPRPGYWIKYFKDDHQRLLFPPNVRRELFGHLDRAAALATTPVVRERLAQTRAAFEVTELFCRHDELRDELARLAHNPAAPPESLHGAVTAFTAARAQLIRGHVRVRREHPLALSAELIPEYLRNDPRPRALHRLAALGVSGSIDSDLVQSAFAGRRPDPAGLAAPGRELLTDPELRTLRKREVHPFIALDWSEPDSPWKGKGEPFETRRIELHEEPDHSSNATSALRAVRSIRYSGVNQEGLYQTVGAQPGALYRATVSVRGKVSPGNQTFLLLTFADAEGRNIDSGHIDRLPLGEWREWTTLEVIVRAPKDAKLLGFGLRALYQVNDDYVEFAAPSLWRIEPLTNAPE